MPQYSWIVNRCKRVPETDAITEVEWTCYATEGERTGKATGTNKYTNPDLKIPYASLTPESILNLCWANGVNKTFVESQAAADLAKQPSK